MSLSVLCHLTAVLACVNLHSALAADKPGVCPKELPEICYLVPICDSDTDCEGNLKCCFNGCSNVCVEGDPVVGKPGFCPRVCGPGLCVEECSVDMDCQGNLICCSNGCGHQCMKPDKPGFCPRPKPLLPLCKDECCSDADCKGNHKCCNSGCGLKCMKPCRRKWQNYM